MPHVGDGDKLVNSKLTAAALNSAMGKPQIGRREEPEPDDPKAKRRALVIGVIAGAVVVAVFFVIMLFLGQANPLQEGVLGS